MKVKKTKKRYIIRTGNAYLTDGVGDPMASAHGGWTDDKKKARIFDSAVSAYHYTLILEPFGKPAYPACEVEEV